MQRKESYGSAQPRAATEMPSIEWQWRCAVRIGYATVKYCNVWERLGMEKLGKSVERNALSEMRWQSLDLIRAGMVSLRNAREKM